MRDATGQKVRRVSVGGDAAFAYIGTCLDASGGPLATMLLARGLRGDVTAVVPADALDDRVFKFREGGLTPSTRVRPPERITRVPDLDNDLIDEVSSFLSAHNQGLFVVEAAWLTSDGGQLYALGFAEDDVDALRQTLRTGKKTLEFVACLTAAALADVIAQRGRSEAQVPEAAMAEIAKTASHVFIGAYDGEGFLVWRPLRN